MRCFERGHIGFHEHIHKTACMKKNRYLESLEHSADCATLIEKLLPSKNLSKIIC